MVDAFVVSHIENVAQCDIFDFAFRITLRADADNGFCIRVGVIDAVAVIVGREYKYILRPCRVAVLCLQENIVIIFSRFYIVYQ